MYIGVFKASTYITIDSSRYIINIHVADRIKIWGMQRKKTYIFVGADHHHVNYDVYMVCSFPLFKSYKNITNKL